jgi:hypothetical protein
MFLEAVPNTNTDCYGPLYDDRLHIRCVNTPASRMEHRGFEWGTIGEYAEPLRPRPPSSGRFRR